MKITDKIQPYIDSGLISVNTHTDDNDIKIYNYTHKCQYDKEWNNVTTKCRGLILNTKTGEILAKPFEKFFNVSEHTEVFEKEIPNETPIITEKVDGSLGILYWIKDVPYIATRGSFVSDQAMWATAWFRKNVDYSELPRDITLLFEIIYRENRIVISYDFEGLVYLAGIDTETGRQVSYRPEDKNARVVKRIENTDLKTLSELDDKEGEGFVVFYPKANLRLKVKFPEYVRLHKILTGLSVKGIWEYLKEHGVNTDMRKIAEDAPDEFYTWINTVANDFKETYKVIEDHCEAVFEELLQNEMNDLSKEWTRKDWAFYITQKKYPSILFAMLDKRKYSEQIWKILRPNGAITFKEEI